MLLLFGMFLWLLGHASYLQVRALHGTFPSQEERIPELGPAREDVAYCDVDRLGGENGEIRHEGSYQDK